MTNHFHKFCNQQRVVIVRLRTDNYYTDSGKLPGAIEAYRKREVGMITNVVTSEPYYLVVFDDTRSYWMFTDELGEAHDGE